MTDQKPVYRPSWKAVLIVLVPWIVLVVLIWILQGCASTDLNALERRSFVEMNSNREQAGLEPLVWYEYYQPNKEETLK